MTGPDLMHKETFGGETGNDGVLLMLFDRLVREHGAVRAGELLGINYRTVAKVRETRRLTPYITNALEVFMLSGANPVIQELTGRMSALEGRVEGMDGRLRTLSEVVEQGRKETQASLESVVKMVRSTARKVDKMGVTEKKPAKSTDRTGGGKKAASAKPVGKKEPQQKVPWFPRRTYPQIVTIEAADDDQYVYKEAWPVVHEWRELSKVTHFKGKALTWMKRRERVLELEVRLLDEFQLTLPPEKHPIDKEWRRKLLRWNDDDLRSIRGRIVRSLMLRWVRRILTLGLWRK